jgi:hypothetical protein
MKSKITITCELEDGVLTSSLSAEVAGSPFAMGAMYGCIIRRATKVTCEMAASLAENKSPAEGDLFFAGMNEGERLADSEGFLKESRMLVIEKAVANGK